MRREIEIPIVWLKYSELSPSHEICIERKCCSTEPSPEALLGRYLSTRRREHIRRLFWKVRLDDSRASQDSFGHHH